jgi:putative hemolysin
VIEKILLLALFIAFSAFFSASEIALISLSRLKIQHMVDKKKPNAKAVKKLRDNTHKLLITILIGNNLVNISASIVALYLGIEVFHGLGFSLTESQIAGIVTGAITLLVLIFGEIFPKTIANQYSEHLALNLAKPIEFFVVLFSPVSWFLDKVNKLFFLVLKIKPEKKPFVTEEELTYIIATGAEEGSIKEREKVLLHNIFKFDDIEAKEVMIPRPNIIAIEVSAPMQEIMQIVRESEFSRIPVFKRRLDNIIGVLYSKDLLDASHKDKKSFSLKRMLRPAIFVPENKKLDSLFRTMQRKKVHIAFVVNEYGGLSGLITMEDLLEEIVGEIYDETDDVHELIRKKSSREALVDGAALVEDVNEEIGLHLEQKGHYVTISGFILDKLHRIPNKGEVLKVDNAIIEIRKVTNKRIVQVNVSRK